MELENIGSQLSSVDVWKPRSAFARLKNTIPRQSSAKNPSQERSIYYIKDSVLCLFESIGDFETYLWDIWLKNDKISLKSSFFKF